MDDTEPRKRFIQGDEEAFERIVRRHVDMVFAAAQRQMKDPAGAEDVTQGVFLLLARKAATLAQREGTIVGWLLKATYFACRGAKRAEARRKFYERKGMEMRPKQVEPKETGWEEIGAELDAALVDLGVKDR